MEYKAYARFMGGNFDPNVINKFYRKKSNIYGMQANTIIIPIETQNLSLILFADHRS